MIINRDKLVFRKATSKDIPELIKFKILLLDELNEYTNKDNLEKLKIELEKFFTEYLETENFVSWVVEYEGELIATSGLILWRVPPRYDCVHGKYGYISNMYTVPKARRNGISTELIKKLIEDAKKMNLDILNLHATKDGIKMYRRFGFKDPKDPEIELNLGNY
ncbi:MAG: Acetyltransferase (GNAT) family protein [Candidatus Methanofastidiosum methylothiophilum]|uniref:Acetyltransferase (GNAT) family protein n=1 Tax=Candidatus Methanofastidiosum methylothiophilum TaxID=1705564 RepID=A0A150IYI7_9EURY|nr:MAG: Acetyltransferase (GNAT) family protein [Candidatus Methanofastidiosum methylthiophilus]KYC47902.1 MAG: Acetyltransferase (GNAT) family protein [Candidatus Methanofastidiosum methylthiophilus]KYC50073.1 MAG: Acetyltransferase (GNAT) family protein [Candidatus Methanofastidiosum methylthiophilus]